MDRKQRPLQHFCIVAFFGRKTGFHPRRSLSSGRPSAGPVGEGGQFPENALVFSGHRPHNKTRANDQTAAMSLVWFDLLKAIALGIVEGLTEFLPVSSTGHLLLVQRFFGFDDGDFGKTFAVLIQFGAILALLSIYFVRLWKIAVGFFRDPAARRFVIGVLVAFLPAAVIGALAHDFIKSVLFNVWIVCFTLIVGGAILLWVDRMNLSTRYHEATRFSLPMYFVIG